MLVGWWVVFLVGVDGRAELAAWVTGEWWVAFFLDLSETYKCR